MQPPPYSGRESEKSRARRLGVVVRNNGENEKEMQRAPGERTFRAKLWSWSYKNQIKVSGQGERRRGVPSPRPRRPLPPAARPPHLRFCPASCCRVCSLTAASIAACAGLLPPLPVLALSACSMLCIVSSALLRRCSCSRVCGGVGGGARTHGTHALSAAGRQKHTRLAKAARLAATA